MADSLRELDILIRARYPIIAVSTFEERRLEDILLDIARARNKDLVCWTVIKGLYPHIKRKEGENQPGRSMFGSSQDPHSALDKVITHSSPTIFLFKDFHPYMKEPGLVRRLRETAQALRNSFKTLVLVSPRFEIPFELEKDVTPLEFNLPGEKELHDLLERTIQSIDARGKPMNVPGEVREKIVRATLGLTLMEAENVFAKAMVMGGTFDLPDIRLILSEKERIIAQSGVLDYYPASEEFAGIGGLDILKQWLQRRQIAFGGKAKEFGLPAPRGVLLIGVQGCGKSLTAKAVAGLWAVPLIRLDVGKLFSTYVGSSEENTRRAIQVAEAVAPAVLWIDEIDKAFSGRDQLDGGTTARVLGTFISWLQEKTKPVFVIATANNISNLPAELMRKGRFDDIFFIDLPVAGERKDIFRIHLKKRGFNPDTFDVASLADVAQGFSGSEIEEAIIAAMYEVFDSEGDNALNTDAIIRSIRETRPLSKTMEEAINSIRSWATDRARPASSAREETLERSTWRQVEL